MVHRVFVNTAVGSNRDRFAPFFLFVERKYDAFASTDDRKWDAVHV